MHLNVCKVYHTNLCGAVDDIEYQKNLKKWGVVSSNPLGYN